MAPLALPFAFGAPPGGLAGPFTFCLPGVPAHPRRTVHSSWLSLNSLKVKNHNLATVIRCRRLPSSLQRNTGTLLSLLASCCLNCNC